MTDYIRLADGTELKIESGASLSEIIYKASSDLDATSVARKFTEANVSHVEFFSKDDEGTATEPTGIYDDLAVVNAYVAYFEDEPEVLISLREKTSLEKRLDAIETEQEMQNEAIDFLAMD